MMKGDLNDLRLLKLAEMYEAAYEAFVLEVAERLVEDPEVRRKLMALVSPTDRHHERIVAQMERLNARLSASEQAGIAHAAILDVCDVERAARDFYLAQADSVHDAEVAALFRRLAQEEQGHMRIAEETLHLAEHRAGTAPGDEGLADMFRLLRDANAMLLREGVTDFSSRLARERPRDARGT